MNINTMYYDQAQRDELREKWIMNQALPR